MRAKGSFKPAIWGAILIALAPGRASSEAAGRSDQEALQARAGEFAAAWNKHDAAAMSLLWVEDGDFIDPFGRVATGRTEIKTLLTEEHATFMKDTQYTVVVRWTRLVKPDVALITWDGTIAGIRASDGGILPPLKHTVTAFVVKRDGKWWTMAARAAVAASLTPATPPGK
jgi:uncharacterized protein (TIGR02246 family)